MNVLTRIEKILTKLHLDKKEVVFINRLKGEPMIDDDDSKLIIVFDIDNELRDVL